jgi:hypothetical protein
MENVCDESRCSSLKFETNCKNSFDMRSKSNPNLNFWRQIRKGNSLSRTSNASMSSITQQKEQAKRETLNLAILNNFTKLFKKANTPSKVNELFKKINKEAKFCEKVALMA